MEHDDQRELRPYRTPVPWPHAVALAVIVALFALALRTAGAQSTDAASQSLSHADDPVLVLAMAKVCIGEAGFNHTTGDCAAIVGVLMRRAERLGISPIAMVRAYSGRHLDRSRTDARRWIAWLRLDGAQPRGWPRGARWSRHRDRWLSIVEHVRDVLGGHVGDPCPGAEHWGAPSLDRSRDGWERVECSTPVLNVYWTIPRANGGAS